MMKNFEQLTEKVDEIKTLCEQLKADINLPEDLKQSQVESLKEMVKTLRKEIREETETLQNEVDKEQKGKKAEGLLKDLQQVSEFCLSFSSSGEVISAQSEGKEESFFSKAKKWIGEKWNTFIDFVKRFFESKKQAPQSQPRPTEVSTPIREQKENISQSETISDEMFQNLLTMEGKQKFKATIHAKFGESFPTGPYGMVYKRIDEKGKPLKQAIPFQNEETVSQEWALKNAKAYYDRSAKEWKKVLQGKTYTQHQLDALVSASGGTTVSKKDLQTYVLDNWNTPEKISEYLLDFATKAKGDGQVKTGLVIRRQFESQWFKGESKSFTDCQKDYFGWNRKAA